jgi:hypothetical protein
VKRCEQWHIWSRLSMWISGGRRACNLNRRLLDRYVLSSGGPDTSCLISKLTKFNQTLAVSSWFFSSYLKHWWRGGTGLLDIYTLCCRLVFLNSPEVHICIYIYGIIICVHNCNVFVYKYTGEYKQNTVYFLQQGEVYVYMRGQQHPCWANPRNLFDYSFVS